MGAHHRPTVPGPVVQLGGRLADRPGEMRAVILMQDEATYRELASRPEQDVWHRTLVEHLETEPTWDDVTWELARLDIRDVSG